MESYLDKIKHSMRSAGFREFKLRQTIKPTNLMRTIDQKDTYIKELEKAVSERDTRLVKAVAYFKKQQNEIALLEKKLKEALLVQSPLMNIDIPEQHASDDIVEEIRLAYPKKVDPSGARIAIKKAIVSMKRNGGSADCLLMTTTEYAREIKRFVPNKQHELWGKIPAPAVWYNQQRYELDPETWTAHLRQGKYVAPEKPQEVSRQPEHWRVVIKVLYPESDCSRTLWEHFSINHPDIAKEVKERYNEVCNKLGL